VNKLKINLSYPIIVFDTETGGLNPELLVEWDLTGEKSRETGSTIQGTVKQAPAPILEIGAIALDPVTLEELSSFHTYCGPDANEPVEDLLGRCHPKALEVN